jgi:hypothetical protein
LSIKSLPLLLQPDAPQVPAFYSLNANTKISFVNPEVGSVNPTTKAIGVGGLEKQRALIQEMIDLHLHKSESMNIHGNYMDTRCRILHTVC